MEYEVKKPLDLTKINTKDMGELLWWSYILQISPEVLLTTIDREGSDTDTILKLLHPKHKNEPRESLVLYLILTNN